MYSGSTVPKLYPKDQVLKTMLPLPLSGCFGLTVYLPRRHAGCCTPSPKIKEKEKERDISTDRQQPAPANTNADRTTNHNTLDRDTLAADVRVGGNAKTRTRKEAINPSRGSANRRPAREPCAATPRHEIRAGRHFLPALPTLLRKQQMGAIQKCKGWCRTRHYQPNPI